MSCGNFSGTTVFLKVATLILIVPVLLLIVGSSVPRWSTLTISADVFGIDFDTSYHVGLWKDCSCTSILGSETCYCFEKLTLTDWLRAVQAMITLGVIGLMISVIISIIILFSRQDKTLRCINIVVAGCTGLFIIIGVIIFGIENTEDFEELFNFIDSISLDLDTHGSLSASFYLSTIAGALCLLLCVPLLVKDYLTPVPLPTQTIIPMPLQYTNQGHVMIPPPGQTHVVVQQPGGYMQPQAHAPAVYIPPGQQMQGQSMYPPQQQQQQYGVQYSHQDGNQQYKS